MSSYSYSDTESFSFNNLLSANKNFSSWLLTSFQSFSTFTSSAFCYSFRKVGTNSGAQMPPLGLNSVYLAIDAQKESMAPRSASLSCLAFCFASWSVSIFISYNSFFNFSFASSSTFCGSSPYTSSSYSVEFTKSWEQMLKISRIASFGTCLNYQQS